MVGQISRAQASAPGAPTAAHVPPLDVAPITWRRLAGPLAATALVLSLVGAVGQALGTVVSGRLAAGPSVALVVALAVCIIGSALVDAVGRVVWSGVSDRAEGRLRDDLVAVAWAQPVQRLTEQAAGEILDRVDDDTHEVGNLLRRQVWGAARTVFSTIPMWIVAGLTWWPAWFAFPLTGAVVWLLIRGLLPAISERKVAEEIAWTDHAAVFEEGVAARDDLRTSLGAAFVLRRSTELAARTLALFRKVVAAQVRLLIRSAGLLQGLLAAVAVVGAALVLGGGLDIGELVTLFLVTTTFVGTLGHFAEQLPDLQAGLGAVARLRQLLDAEREPVGGKPVPPGSLDVTVTGLQFRYADGAFTLRVDDLQVPAGATIALVGRSGSGKSTLASLLSRAVEPPPGTVRLGGRDVTELDLLELRRAVGVVTQRTEILAGTLAENITMFAPDSPEGVTRAQVLDAIEELGLTEWAQSLPDGVDTQLGSGGITLSAGEEQLVAFARLLVRDARLVVLDEATARMDPRTEQLVVTASSRLLRDRTGVIIAHRLVTTRRADRVVVLADGAIVQNADMRTARSQPGPYRTLLLAAAEDDGVAGAVAGDMQAIAPETHPVDHVEPVASDGPIAVGTARRRTDVPDQPPVETGPGLARVVWRALWTRPSWAILGAALFGVSSLVGGYGAVTAFLWGRTVQALQAPGADAADVVPWLGAMVASLVLWVVIFPLAIRQYLPWWSEILLRVRTNVLIAQTAQRRLPRRPPGEIVARAMDSDRLARYADLWVDFINGLVIIVVSVLLSQSLLAGAVLLVVMLAAAAMSSFGRPIAGRSAARAATARANFGRVLVSCLEATRTVKLAAATDAVRAHLRRVDAGRVDAAVREHRVQGAIDGVPMVIVQCGVVAVWAIHLAGGWDLATALMLSVTVMGFDFFGLVAGWVITQAPGTQAWLRETSGLAAGSDLVRLPHGFDLLRGEAPGPVSPPRAPAIRELALEGVSVIHEDGTIGVEDVTMTARRGELVLLLGQVGSGKSSLLRALSGLVDHTGTIRWNGEPVTDVELFCRPNQVAYVAQAPRVLSGSYEENILLDHAGRDAADAIDAARLGPDVLAAGGLETVVGHRGVRLSGGQVQRLALARALATRAELVIADDVSSALDATTEVELWRTLRERGTTVIGSTSKRVALSSADQVLVLAGGAVVAHGPWSELAGDWGHLAG